MKRLLLIALVIVALGFGGCEFFPQDDPLPTGMHGSWVSIGENVVDFGGTLGCIRNIEATFGPGTYEFLYQVVPDLGEPASYVTCEHSGTMNPDEPVVDDAISCMVTAKAGDYAPPVDSVFDAKILYLEGPIMVLGVDTNDDNALFEQTWTFERQ